MYARCNMPLDYRTVSLPISILEQIDRTIQALIDNGIDLGFNSRADFIKAAIREYMKQLVMVYLLGCQDGEDLMEKIRSSKK